MTYQRLWVRYGMKTLFSCNVSAIAAGLTYYTVGKYLWGRISMFPNARKDLGLPSRKHVE